jgi:hypothetical protein
MLKKYSVITFLTSSAPINKFTLYIQGPVSSSDKQNTSGRVRQFPAPPISVYFWRCLWSVFTTFSAKHRKRYCRITPNYRGLHLRTSDSNYCSSKYRTALKLNKYRYVTLERKCMHNFRSFVTSFIQKGLKRNLQIKESTCLYVHLVNVTEFK